MGLLEKSKVNLTFEKSIDEIHINRTKEEIISTKSMEAEKAF